ncbi:MAG: translation elongation factor Ts [Proteobacteria bacterium]|nr:translation elongation factor Ts [Pseudomonadota bacterium]
MQVTAAMVKELRERSGAAMMDCKKALVETDGDIEAALDVMRKSGAAKAAKKAGRIAADGAVIVRVAGDSAVVVEINSETDFVAKDENFVSFATNVATTILSSNATTPDELAEQTLANTSGTVESERQQLSAKVGEKISIRRFERLQSSNLLIDYVHGNRIGVLVELQGGDLELGKDVAMHIAASNPVCVSEEQVPAELVSKEREIQIAQAEQSGKTLDIAEKMVAGRIRKFLAEITLTGQPFVKDPDKTVGKLLKDNNAVVVNFIRFEVGAGIEKKAENFAQEVMAQARMADGAGS